MWGPHLYPYFLSLGGSTMRPAGYLTLQLPTKVGVNMSHKGTKPVRTRLLTTLGSEDQTPASAGQSVYLGLP